jgi:hypothetical protein
MDMQGNGGSPFEMQQQQANRDWALQLNERQSQELLSRSYADQFAAYREQMVKRHKRPPPTPAGTSLNSTPVHAAQGGQQEGETIPFIQLDTLDDTGAVTATAARLNININDDQALQEFMASPAPATMGQLLRSVRAYHEAVIRPELRQLIMQIDRAVQGINEEWLQQRQEFNWLAADSREMQKQRAAVQVILQGFPITMTPTDRYLMVQWMLQNTKEIVDYSVLHKTTTNTALLNEPVTVRAGPNWSKASILTFKSFDMRQAFLRAHGRNNQPLWAGTGAVQGSHIRSTPAIPPFQRRIESVLWTLVNGLNKRDEVKNKHLTVLWRCGVIMKPQDTT